MYIDPRGNVSASLLYFSACEQACCAPMLVPLVLSPTIVSER